MVAHQCAQQRVTTPLLLPGGARPLGVATPPAALVTTAHGRDPPGVRAPDRNGPCAPQPLLADGSRRVSWMVRPSHLATRLEPVLVPLVNLGPVMNPGCAGP